MQRNLNELSSKKFDLLVIGGGIYGACVAWEASLRGLSVALVEKNDFGSATSANSLKVIHGGLRYLQHADFRRMRQSIAERKTLLKIAPHLIHPLPVLVPTYGHGLKGIEAMVSALAINDCVSLDRNLGLSDAQKHIPRGRTISPKACLEMLPGISADGLTGGAMFYDAQVYNSERLLISFLQSASAYGAEIANYSEVVGFLSERENITGATVRDGLTGIEFDIQARVVVNTSGPWVSEVLRKLTVSSPLQHQPLAKAMNLVIRPLFDHAYAVGISSRKRYCDRDALINKGSRLFFVAPWRNKSLVGTAYSPYDGDPDSLAVTEPEIEEFLHDFNAAYPSADLALSDVEFVHRGLLPSSEVYSGKGDVQLTKHYQLYDHRNDGVTGLLTVIGVKYTTARGVAQHAVDTVFQMLEKTAPKSHSSTQPLHGGKIDQFDRFLQTALQTWCPQFPEESIRRLVYNYGSAYADILAYLNTESQFSQSASSDLDVLTAEVRYGIQQEMAQTLGDFVFRRSELGSAGRPEESSLRKCAETMGQELGWSLAKTQAELKSVDAYFNHLLPACSVSVN